MTEKLNKEELSFEEAIDKLDVIVRELDSDLLSLDEAMERFTEGLELIKFCQKELDQAEGKLEQIVKEDGEFNKVIPFDLTGEDNNNQEDD
ncbi:MAG: exodeoxyribonuclease VII small subunit [Halarsenatibacteraceae bacterium]